MTGLVIIRRGPERGEGATRTSTLSPLSAAAADLNPASVAATAHRQLAGYRLAGLRVGDRGLQAPSRGPAIFTTRFNSVGGKSPRSLSRVKLAQQPCSVGMILAGPRRLHVFQSMVSFNAGELHLQFTTGASACPTNVFPKTEMDFPR